MPGISGFTHPAPTEATARFLQQMSEALHDEPACQSSHHTEIEISLGRVGLSIIQPLSQPAWNENCNVAVVMEGILLSTHTKARGIFDPGVLKNLVAEHLGGQNHNTRLGALISIELWHRQFLAGKYRIK